MVAVVLLATYLIVTIVLVVKWYHSPEVTIENKTTVVGKDGESFVVANLKFKQTHSSTAPTTTFTVMAASPSAQPTDPRNLQETQGDTSNNKPEAVFFYRDPETRTVLRVTLDGKLHIFLDLRIIAELCGTLASEESDKVMTKEELVQMFTEVFSEAIK